MGKLALITARGGSKRLPNKNLRLFCGKPLVVWTVESAIEAGIFDRIIISTDSEQIAEVAKEAGAEVPFMRPPELAVDNATSLAVVNHALDFFVDYSKIMLLQPTSPLRDASHILSAFRLMEQLSCNSVVSVSKRKSTSNLQYHIKSDLTLIPFGNQMHGYKPTVSVNGAIYLFERNWFLQTQRFLDRETRAYIMDVEVSVDIDTIEDWIEAQALKRAGRKGKVHGNC